MAECPLCEEYSGSEESVEAHISSKSDEDHQGEIGKDYRDQLRSAGGSVLDKAKEVVGSGSDSGDSDSDDGSDGGMGSCVDSPGRDGKYESGRGDESGDSGDGSNGSMLEGSVEEAKIDMDEEDDGAELSLVVTGALALIIWRAITSNNNRGRF